MAPITWLLQRIGSDQPLTQAGYLNRPFVLAVHEERPCDEDGDWSARRYRLTPAGETLVLAMLRATAAGPRGHP